MPLRTSSPVSYTISVFPFYFSSIFLFFTFHTTVYNNNLIIDLVLMLIMIIFFMEKVTREVPDTKRKNAKRSLKSDKEFLEFTLKYQQVLAERDAGWL